MNIPDQNRGVVVTGMGVVCPIGIGLFDYWTALANGQSGVRVRQEFADTSLPLKHYAPVTGFEAKQWVKPRKALKVMCEPIQYGFAAARMAAEHAGINSDDFDAERVGTVFGSETFFSDPANVSDVFRICVGEGGSYRHDAWGEAAMKEIEPLWMLKYLPNMATSHVSIAVDARGPSNTICQREVSGLLALIEGQELIRRGICDAVVVGGTGCCTSLTVNLYHGIEMLSAATGQPGSSCRPFELNRDGTVYGDGAGAMVIESEEHANRRGAKILCHIASSKRSFCDPTSDEFINAIAENLDSTVKDSNLDLQDFAHVNAHGLGSPHWDRLEAVGIERVVGDLPTLGLKSYFGYLGAGTAMIELIASVLSMHRRLLPATLNYDNPDPACPCHINKTPVAAEQSAALKLAFSVHGQITSVAVRV